MVESEGRGLEQQLPVPLIVACRTRHGARVNLCPHSLLLCGRTIDAGIDDVCTCRMQAEKLENSQRIGCM